MSKEAIADLDDLAAEWRYVITDMICRAGSGHLGGALSLVEIILTLYWRIMRVDPANPAWADRDRLVLSKGHGGPTLYTALAYKGYFPAKELTTLNHNGTRLPSHCDMNQTPGIDMTTGSLGQGLSAATGMALAGKIDRKDYRVFCIIGDGESNEGQNWEAAMYAAHHRLDNLIGITDCNKLQIDGYTKDIVDMHPLAEKWRSFNWHVLETDGHSIEDLDRTFKQAMSLTGKPKMIIAHTLKGKGHCKIENQIQSHHVRVPDEKTYREFADAVKIENFNWPY
jgi:transketolase